MIRQLVQREISVRYKASLLGMAWSFLTPILMLAIYTFVFSVIFQARWEIELKDPGEFALVLFAGLIVFQLIAECIGRAPGLISENPSYVKRVVFPLEALPWVVVINATFNALVSYGILVIAYLIMVGSPPITAFWLPAVLLPLILTTCGLVWFLSSAGLFVRDVRQIVGVAIPVLMFASPVFYPISALPEGMRPFMRFNPMALTIEQVRSVLLFGKAPDFSDLGLLYLLAIVVAWAGLVWFLVTKRGFADVL
ncbi:MAG: ABC transporter permease [Pyrinomonadaceae bacterium]